MEDKNYLNDLKDIKEMMSKSSQFISLSGLSGVLAGIYALVGGWYADKLLSDYFTDSVYSLEIVENLEFKLIYIAILIIAASILSGLLLSNSKSKKIGVKLWNETSKRLVVNFCIPLLTGGILVFILIVRQFYELIIPTTLLFYGMACIHASKYTLGDVKYLGITITIIGLLSAYFYKYSIPLWILGFGFCHIFYGGMMWFKYDRK
jgi:hypothetical protein